MIKIADKVPARTRQGWQVKYRYKDSIGHWVGLSDKEKDALIIQGDTITILVSPRNEKHHALLCDWQLQRYKITK
jgi:hypothetical protein